MNCNQDGSAAVTEAIVNRYMSAAMKHGVATEKGFSDDANSAYQELELLLDEIDKHGAREKLVKLLTHPNPSVRAEAAYHTYVLDPRRSESVLEEVASLSGFVGFSAGMTLKQLKNGALTPK